MRASCVARHSNAPQACVILVHYAPKMVPYPSSCPTNQNLTILVLQTAPNSTPNCGKLKSHSASDVWVNIGFWQKDLFLQPNPANRKALAITQVGSNFALNCSDSNQPQASVESVTKEEISRKYLHNSTHNLLCLICSRPESSSRYGGSGQCLNQSGQGEVIGNTGFGINRQVTHKPHRRRLQLPGPQQVQTLNTE